MMSFVITRTMLVTVQTITNTRNTMWLNGDLCLFLYSNFSFLVIMYFPANARLAGIMYCSQIPGNPPVMLTKTSILVVANAIASGGRMATVGKRSRSTKKGNGLSPYHGLTTTLASDLRFSLKVMELIGKLVVKVKTG